jgi:hypothetical protein
VMDEEIGGLIVKMLSQRSATNCDRGRVYPGFQSLFAM